VRGDHDQVAVDQDHVSVSDYDHGRRDHGYDDDHGLLLL
jgi:hypothetical protein